MSPSAPIESIGRLDTTRRGGFSTVGDD